MGGQAGPRGAALAARWADEYNTPFATLDELLPMKDRVTAACEAAGREPIPFSLMTGVLIGRDEGEVRERTRLLKEFRSDNPAAGRRSSPARSTRWPSGSARSATPGWRGCCASTCCTRTSTRWR
jgi:alkanesulfonate monooxygenase SsuD/methylene tetrahydromethanopterin reductase-like flavin-dependent oxidoreductase (luciferase family)